VAARRRVVVVMPEPVFPLVGVGTGMIAVTLWAVLMLRVLLFRYRGVERRASWVLMSGTALLASIGALAAAIGSAQTLEVVPSLVPYAVLVFLTNVGRGALAMAALILLIHGGMPDRRT
jgi:hypothetical protein